MHTVNGKFYERPWAVVQISLPRKLSKHSVIRFTWKTASQTGGSHPFVHWILLWGKHPRGYFQCCAFPSDSNVFWSSKLWLGDWERCGEANVTGITCKVSHTSRGGGWWRNQLTANDDQRNSLKWEWKVIKFSYSCLTLGYYINFKHCIWSYSINYAKLVMG